MSRLSGHHSDCQKLLTLLNVALPDTFSKYIEHKGKGNDQGRDNECLMNILGILVKRALKNPEEITGYAVLCSEIAEAFDIDPFYNPFKVALARQLKTELDDNRTQVDVMKCRNQEEHNALEAEIADEKDKARRTVLGLEQKARRRMRDQIKSLMKLFGELYNFGLLTDAVLRLCIIKLLVPVANAEEVDVECFCVLMQTAGAKLESTQEGIEIADKYMKLLETIIDQGRADKFSEKNKKKIGELFFQRAKQWTDGEVEPLAHSEIFQDNELIAEAKANKEFLSDLRAAVSKFEKEQDWLDFMIPFSELKVWNEERLRGSAQIIARYAMSNPKQAPMLALVCRRLSIISAPAADSHEPKTFVNFLKDFCDQEKANIRTNALCFRNFKSQVQALKKCTDSLKFQQQKEELVKKLKTFERPKNFVSFFGELFNAEVVKSAEILDFFVALMEPDTISDVSVECFCSLFTIVASKMLIEPNRKTLLKDSVVKLSKLVKAGDFSMKARQLADDLEKTAHFRFKLQTGFGPPTLYKPKQPVRLSATLSTENLWTSPGKPEGASHVQETTPQDFFKKYLPCTQTLGPPPGLRASQRSNSGILHHA